MEGICNLCKKKKKLVKSHIYPDFLFKNLGLYFPDQKGQGRVHKANFYDDSLRYNTKGLPSSPYDAEILCEECDNFLNEKYENYAKNKMFDEVPEYEKIHYADSGFELVTFFGIDYSRFKLFMLSIFWRASISDRFPGIKLTINDEESIRKMLVNEQPGEEDEFCVALFHLNDPEITHQLITDIKEIKTDNQTCYLFFCRRIPVSVLS